MSLSRRFGLALAALLGGFLLLMAARLGWGYLAHPDGQVAQAVQYGVGLPDELEKKNYASKDGSGRRGSSDAKYEKVGTLAAETRDYDADEAAARSAVVEQGGIVQSEHEQGLPGGRQLHIDVGVPPERFDALVTALGEIGRARGVEIRKVDKTNEYRQLRAERASLEKTRASLAELRGKGGAIDELVGLESTLLDIEKQIQGLDVRLGEFDSENEYNTVRYTLVEGRTARAVSIPTTHRLSVAFKWSVRTYRTVLMLVCFAAAAALLLAMVWQRLRGGEGPSPRG